MQMKSYMWRFTADDGTGMVAILADVLAEFEGAAAEGKRALAVTGSDIAACCDVRLGDANPYDRYRDTWRNALNQDVKKQL